MANPSNSQQALAQLQANQKATQNPNQILEAQRQGLGVNQAQETVTGLRGAINNTTKLLKQVAPSVMGRTGSSLVTNAQASKQIQNEQAPISQNLSEQGTEYNQASEDLGQLQSRASEAASGIYQGQQDRQSYLQNLYTTLYGREQAAAEAKRAEIDRREQVRQFNEQLALSKQELGKKYASTGSGGFGLSGGSSKPSGGGNNDIKAKAVGDVNQLMNRRNTASFLQEVQAIAKSAGYGNTYDQAKLELIRAKQPGLFDSKGKLNATRLKGLAGVYK